MILFIGSSCNRVEPEPRNARILIATHGMLGFNTLIQLDDNMLIVTLFSFDERSSMFESIGTFDDTLLEDFFTQSPLIKNIMGFIDRGIARDANNAMIVVPVNRGIIEQVETELSQAQLENVWMLIENIVQNEPDMEFRTVPFIRGSPTYVWAMIDDNMYWSWSYPSDYFDYLTRSERREEEQRIAPFINRDLLRLVAELNHLSQHSTHPTQW